MKSSQIQMGETIAVLFVFIILIVIGLIAYVGFARSKAKQQAEEHISLSANDIAQRVMFLPEVSCSFDNVPRYNCIDIVKLANSSTVMERNWLLYRDLFFESNISVEVIFPNPKGPFALYDNKPSDWDTKLETVVPVAVYNPLAARGYEYEFGLLKVEVYR